MIATLVFGNIVVFVVTSVATYRYCIATESTEIEVIHTKGE